MTSSTTNGAARPRRSIQLLRSTSIDGTGVFRITVGRRTTVYALTEIPCMIGGRGFAVHLLGLGTLYHVRVSHRREDCSCECMGFYSRGHCRHILGLRALLQRDLI